MASVSLRGVSKSYGGIDAVKKLHLEIPEGEFLVLLGPSGCGKTTTLRIVAGFTQPTTGQVLIGGVDVTNLLPRQRNIGMVFQNYALFPNMSVAENIGFGLRERRVPSADIAKRVNDLLAMVQLTGRGDAYPSELSGGQQQRVALARALAFNPKLLLMDEPLGALDLKLRESMQIELHRIQRSLGITTIMVTHDQQEAMSLANSIVVMAGGEIQQAGTPEELYTEPRNKFVADFIGRNNLLEGTIVASAPGICTVRIAGAFDVDVPTAKALPSGQNVEISIRPQQLMVGATPSGAVNVISGEVEAKRFLGNVIYYSVRLPNRALLLVESSTANSVVGEGEQVAVGWKPEDARLFVDGLLAAPSLSAGRATPQ